MRKDRIYEALTLVKDGQGRPLTDNGKIRNIVIKDHTVALTLLLKAAERDREAHYRHAIEEALHAIGIGNIHIRVKPMDETIPDRDEIPQSAPPSAPLLAPDSGTRFIAIASGKGGVGKSTVTVNLALALTRMGKRVGIIDADIYGFSIPNLLGIEEKPQKAENRIVPVERYGVQLISTGFFVQGNNPVVWRGPMLGKMISTYLNDVDWPPLDYMLIDVPPGTGDIALDINRKIPQCAEIIVTTPHPMASHVAERAGVMAKQTGHRILGVVENMSYFEDDRGIRHYVFGRGGGDLLAEQLQTSLLVRIPIVAAGDRPSDPSSPPSVFTDERGNGAVYSELARKVSRLLS
ncbi:Mrp/NBP35 family ATP-binding protein [Paenibacillus cisolokensis]|uniref:Mrp/NBP35 family ATP-binding protein n=1 Tax=Paenibacillus cisolokensis TaxID=1658519 RepID=UPI003D2D2D46